MFDFLGVFQEYRLKAKMLTLRYVNRIDVPGGMEYPYLQRDRLQNVRDNYFLF